MLGDIGDQAIECSTDGRTLILADFRMQVVEQVEKMTMLFIVQGNAGAELALGPGN